MITKSIPNLFTIGNLFLGIISIMFAFNDNYSFAALMVIIAMLLDGLDGRVARALNVQSEFGKELDSLSDVISFGVAPAFVMYVCAFTEINPVLAWTATAIFPICGALRLARFNVVDGVPGYFTGLPIPAAGGVLATLALFHDSIAVPYLIVAVLLLSYLMVSTVRYPNFKKVGIPKKAIWITPIVIAAAVAIAVWKPEQTPKLIFVPLVLYALLGLKKNVRMIIRRGKKSKKTEEWAETKHSS